MRTDLVEAEEGPRQALMYNVSLRLFSERSFPRYDPVGAAITTFRNVLPLLPENLSAALDSGVRSGPLNPHSCTHLASPFIPGKRMTWQPNARVSIRAIRENAHSSYSSRLFFVDTYGRSSNIRWKRSHPTPALPPVKIERTTRSCREYTLYLFIARRMHTRRDAQCRERATMRSSSIERVGKTIPLTPYWAAPGCGRSQSRSILVQCARTFGICASLRTSLVYVCLCARN